MNSFGRDSVDPRARESSATVPSPLTNADALDALRAVGAHVLVVSRTWTIVHAGHRWDSECGGDARAAIGTDFRTTCSRLASSAEGELLGATMRDGASRMYRTGSRDDGSVDVHVSRTRAGNIVLEMRDRPVDRDSDRETIAPLARALAAETDSATLLRLLAEYATRHCSAIGGTVTELQGADGIIVAASGVTAPLVGMRVPVAGSSIEDAVQRREIDIIDEYHTTSNFVRHQFDSTQVGQVIAAPLIAHDQVLGVLEVMRLRGGRQFLGDDVDRLRLIADHASLALWKSRLFEQAQAANKAKSDFLAAISHELRTPLTALTGYGELLADEILGPMPEAQHEVIERMRSVTHHLNALIDEILTFSSLEAGREQVRAVPVDATEILRAVIAVVEPLATQKGIALAVTMPEHPVPSCTDVDKVRQILVNLAGNAVKFTDHGGVELTLGTENEGRSLRFDVRDTGIGIPVEHVTRLFQPFVQVDAGLTRRHGGTGLGLYISRRLAELLGGTITVSSARGRGSTFTVELPAKIESRVTGARPSGNQPAIA